MWRLRDEITTIATFTRPTLILGPTGAGKELVARALHEASGREGALLPVNCGALVPNLVESALFGHRKGAFTGADTAQKGAFLSADRGTLFLDEVGELPIEVQPNPAESPPPSTRARTHPFGLPRRWHTPCLAVSRVRLLRSRLR